MGNIYESRSSFNRAFKEFIWNEHLVSLLQGCGWLDGGCRSLMRAIEYWMEDEPIQTYQIVKNRSCLHSEHALIRIGKCYIDGDGISTYHALYQRWRNVERLSHVYIRPFKPEVEPPNTAMGIPEVPFYIEEESIEIIANALASRFDKKKLVSLMNR